MSDDTKRILDVEIRGTLQELSEASALLAILTELGPNARKLFIEIGLRLLKGAREHGDFENAAQRDWSREALEEDLDACVYRTLGAMQRAGQL